MIGRQTLPPHLAERNESKCCSACGQQFSIDSEPTLSVAFRRHVLEVHRPLKKPSTQAETVKSKLA